MADLRIENPTTTEAFVAALATANVALPLSPSAEHLGVVLDANGDDVFTVDSNGERPDDEVKIIALWVILAVNSCGGFKLEAVFDGANP